MDIQDQPIPFIEIEQDEETGKDIFKLNPLAIVKLQALKDKKVDCTYFLYIRKITHIASRLLFYQLLAHNVQASLTLQTVF